MDREQQLKFVKQLREETGTNMMACRKALIHEDWDYEKAKEYLKHMPLKNLSVVDCFGEDRVLACGCIKITFFNKYNLTDRDKNRPIIYKDKPIGYIHEVTKYTISAMVDNRYLRLMPEWNIDFDYLMGFDITLGEEND